MIETTIYYKKRSWFKRLLDRWKYGKPVRVIGYSMGICANCMKDSTLINSETRLCNNCTLLQEDPWH